MHLFVVAGNNSMHGTHAVSRLEQLAPAEEKKNSSQQLWAMPGQLAAHAAAGGGGGGGGGGGRGGEASSPATSSSHLPSKMTPVTISWLFPSCGFVWWFSLFPSLSFFCCTGGLSATRSMKESAHHCTAAKRAVCENTLKVHVRDDVTPKVRSNTTHARAHTHNENCMCV